MDWLTTEATQVPPGQSGDEWVPTEALRSPWERVAKQGQVRTGWFCLDTKFYSRVSAAEGQRPQCGAHRREWGELFGFMKLQWKMSLKVTYCPLDLTPWIRLCCHGYQDHESQSIKNTESQQVSWTGHRGILRKEFRCHAKEQWRPKAMGYLKQSKGLVRKSRSRVPSF